MQFIQFGFVHTVCRLLYDYMVSIIIIRILNNLNMLERVNYKNLSVCQWNVKRVFYNRKPLLNFIAFDKLYTSVLIVYSIEVFYMIITFISDFVYVYSICVCLWIALVSTLASIILDNNLLAEFCLETLSDTSCKKIVLFSFFSTKNFRSQY